MRLPAAARNGPPDPFSTDRSTYHPTFSSTPSRTGAIFYDAASVLCDLRAPTLEGVCRRGAYAGVFCMALQGSTARLSSPGSPVQVVNATKCELSVTFFTSPLGLPIVHREYQAHLMQSSAAQKRLR